MPFVYVINFWLSERGAPLFPPLRETLLYIHIQLMHTLELSIPAVSKMLAESLCMG